MSIIPDEKWKRYASAYRESVLQLLVVCMEYNVFKPYETAKKLSSSGSGFIIDTQRGIIVTNAHVIENAVSIVARAQHLGEKDLRCRLISYCPDKDLAIVQIYQEDLDFLVTDLITGKAKNLDMPLGDNFALEETDEVLAIGYPLGQEKIKFTPGHVSGFHANSDEDDDCDGDDCIETSEESPSYVQVTAAINPGNSGGPIINAKGEVVAISAAGYMFMQNIAYGIGSRTLKAILGELLSPINGSLSSVKLGDESELIPKGGNNLLPYEVKVPKMAISWCRTNETLISSLCTSKPDPPALPTQLATSGVYITKMGKNTAAKSLQTGDVLVHVSANIGNHCDLVKGSKCSEEILGGFIDNFGGITINPQGLITTKISRRFALKEIFDVVPIGGEIVLHVIRNGQMYQAKIKYVVDTRVKPTRSRMYHFQPIRYKVYGGMCFTELLPEHVRRRKSIIKYMTGENRFKKFVIITEIFPGTDAHRTRSITPLSIVSKINGISLLEGDKSDEAQTNMFMKGERGIDALDTIILDIEGVHHYMNLETVDKSILMVSGDRMAHDYFSVEKAYFSK